MRFLSYFLLCTLHVGGAEAEKVALLLDLALVMNLELCALDLLSAYLPSSKSKENNFPILTSFLSILHL